MRLYSPIKTPIRIGLIGCGGIVQQAHLPALRILSDMELVHISALADPIISNLNTIGNQINVPQTHHYTDYRQMLDRSDLDLVIIATPHHLHAQQSIEALSAQVSVICEKPMATNLDDADQILDIANKNGLPYTVVHNFLFSSVSRRAMRLLEEDFEDRVFGRSKSLFAKPASATDTAFWRNQYSAGGGSLSDTCYHEIYLLENMIGSPVRYIEGRVKTAFFNFDVDDIALLLLEHENGAVSTVMTSWGASSGQGDATNMCEVHTQGDGLRIVSRGQSLHRFCRSDHRWKEVQVPDLPYMTKSSKSFEGHTGYFVETIQALVNGNSLPITGQKARQNLAIIEGVRKASRERKCVDLQRV